MAVRGIGRLVHGVFGRGYFPHELSFLIDNPLRRLLITPEEIARRLDVQPGARVLELGPGSGFFSGELARRAARLELFDLQPEMLTKARAKLGAGNVGYTAGDARHLPYASGSFDRALAVTVLGEVPEPAHCLRSLRDVLVAGGLLAIHEQFPDPDRIAPADLDRLVTGAGFEPVRRLGPDWNYTAVFRNP
jgi:ubiquinone/menaquinone biosynthesis C-methylase UbiE